MWRSSFMVERPSGLVGPTRRDQLQAFLVETGLASDDVKALGSKARRKRFGREASRFAGELAELSRSRRRSTDKLFFGRTPDNGADFIVTSMCSRQIEVYVFHDELTTLQDATEALAIEVSSWESDGERFSISGAVNIYDGRSTVPALRGEFVPDLAVRSKTRFVAGLLTMVVGALVVGALLLIAETSRWPPFGDLGQNLVASAIAAGMSWMVAVVQAAARKKSRITWARTGESHRISR